MNNPAEAPSRRGYLIAALIAVLGLVLGVGGLVSAISQLSDEIDEFERVDMPGRGTIGFEAGDYTVYYEAWGGAAVPPFQAVLASHTGEAVALTAYSGSFEYSVGGHNGRAVATFSIETPGNYELRSESQSSFGTGQLAVGQGLGGHLLRTLLPALVLFVTLVAAAILAVVTAVRRRRALRRYRLAAPALS